MTQSLQQKLEMSNVLQKIVDHKAIEVKERKSQRPLSSFVSEIKPSSRSLAAALSNSKSDFILECKKASPSKGLIRKDFDIKEILTQYKDFASAISVLTDKKYFQGDFEFLRQASQTVSQPILCKDFFIDEYQVYEARFHGADAILLMLSVLNDDTYQKLASLANELSLDVLTEVHSQEELNRALKLDAKIIGINNRNLKDLSISLDTTEKLAPKINNDRIVISESGIESRQDVLRLAPIVNGFLIGSSIMGQQDIRQQCKSLLFGNVKICGLTQPKDAIEVDKQGGIYGGFIFYPKSKRNIELSKAAEIAAAAPLKYVGVFVNEEIETLVEYANTLSLFAVQLHGNESEEYIAKLKKRLPGVEIWKAVHVTNSVEFNRTLLVDRYLLDNYTPDVEGGSGNQFDWRLLNKTDLDEVILAGGIDASNIKEASLFDSYALDLSSGVEDEPGVKNPNKIEAVFEQLRA